jgi:hypothetical protein
METNTLEHRGFDFRFGYRFRILGRNTGAFVVWKMVAS